MTGNDRLENIAIIQTEWLDVRRVKMQIADTNLPDENGIQTELEIIEKLVSRFKYLSLKDFLSAVHKAAEKELKAPNSYKNLTYVKIQDQLEVVNAARIEKEFKNTKALPEHNADKAAFEKKYEGTPTEALIRNLKDMAEMSEMFGIITDLDKLKDGMNNALRDLVKANGLQKAVSMKTMSIFRKQFIEAYGIIFAEILDLKPDSPDFFINEYIRRRQGHNDFNEHTIRQVAPDMSGIGRAVAVKKLAELHSLERLQLKH